MATFNGATFYTLTDDGFRPDWYREPQITRTPIPGANYEDVQFGGLGNYRVTVSAYVTSDADMGILKGSIGTGVYTLSDLFGDGVNYAKTMLCDVRKVRRRSWAAEWECELTFERQGV